MWKTKDTGDTTQDSIIQHARHITITIHASHDHPIPFMSICEYYGVEYLTVITSCDDVTASPAAIEAPAISAQVYK